MMRFEKHTARIRAVCFFLYLCVLSSCYRLEVSSFEDTPMMPNTEASLAGRYQVVRRFHREVPVEYFFGSSSQPQLISRILREEAGKNQGVLNLSIERTYRPLDVVVSVLTLGLFSRSLIIVEGDVLHWDE